MKRDRYQAGSLWEENGKWWLRYSESHVDGTTARPVKLVGTKEEYPTKKKARLAADKLMESVNEKIAVTRWGHLCDDYETRGIAHLRGYTTKTRVSVVKILRGAFPDERLDYLNTAAGRMKMEDWLNGQKITASYRSDLRAVMRLVFRHGQRWDLIKENPVDLIDVRNRPQSTKPKRPRYIITPDQYAALQDDPELPELGKVILAVMEYTGMRGCEALGLSWEFGDPKSEDYRASDIEFDSDPPKIWIRRSVKEGKYIDEPKTEDSKRTAALTLKLAGILLYWKDTHPILNGWLFGSHYTGRPFLTSHVRDMIKAAATRAGFDYLGFGLHNPRHTFNEAMRDAGASEEERMWGLGQRNPQTNRRYGATNDRAKQLAPFTEKVVSILDRKTGTK